jgi:Fe-S-cluster containining protein
MKDDNFEAKKAGFECVKCGNCCSVPGEVFLTLEEGENIAKFLNVDFEDFRKKSMKKVWRHYIFNMTYKGGCVFWKDRRCSIYEARPEQCRTFPYWDELQASHENWKEIEGYCEGAKKIKNRLAAGKER